MDGLTHNSNPRHCEPIDQKGRNRTTKSKGIKGSDHQEYRSYCPCREQDEFLDNFHVSALTIPKPLPGRMRLRAAKRCGSPVTRIAGRQNHNSTEFSKSRLLYPRRRRSGATVLAGIIYQRHAWVGAAPQSDPIQSGQLLRSKTR